MSHMNHKPKLCKAENPKKTYLCAVCMYSANITWSLGIIVWAVHDINSHVVLPMASAQGAQGSLGAFWTGAQTPPCFKQSKILHCQSFQLFHRNRYRPIFFISHAPFLVALLSRPHPGIHHDRKDSCFSFSTCAPDPTTQRPNNPTTQQPTTTDPTDDDDATTTSPDRLFWHWRWRTANGREGGWRPAVIDNLPTKRREALSTSRVGQTKNI